MPMHEKLLRNNPGQPADRMGHERNSQGTRFQRGHGHTLMVRAIHEHIQPAQARGNVVTMSVEIDQFRDLQASRKLHQHRTQGAITENVKSELPRRSIRIEERRHSDEQIDTLHVNEPPDEPNVRSVGIHRSEIRYAAVCSHRISVDAVLDYDDLVLAKLLNQYLA